MQGACPVIHNLVGGAISIKSLHTYVNCEYDLNFLLLYLDSFSKISHFSRTHQVRRRNLTEPKRKRRRKSTRKVLQIPAHLQNLLMKRYFQIPKFWFDFLCYFAFHSLWQRDSIIGGPETAIIL